LSVFVDTNVLVYAFSDDTKREAAARIVAGRFAISTQVLNEFVNTSLKKQKRSWQDIERALIFIKRHSDQILPITLDLHAEAIALCKAHKLEWYDALILAAALEAQCTTLASEDFQNGRKFGRLTVINPFAAE
jgi:predicted nucleic acid-binding protein